MKALDPPLSRPIIVDTREQIPWTFDMVDRGTGEYFQYDQVLGTLTEGDYSLVGLEDYIRIERKTLADLVQTVIHNRDRWCAELERLSEKIEHPHVFIEANWEDVQAEVYRSAAKPRAIVASIDAFEHDFRPVKFRFCGSRLLAERMAVIKFSVIEKRIDKPKKRRTA